MIPFEKYATYDEIKSQTEAWVQALEAVRLLQLPNPKDYYQVIFSGCGSTYYLSLAAAALYQELTGFAARAIPSGELWLNPQLIIREHTSHLLVAISRSGTTTETLKAVEKFKRERLGEVLVISNSDKTLAKLGDVKMVIDKGQEESVAQTRSFSSMYVAATGFAARMAGRTDLLESMSMIQEIGNRLILEFEPAARQIGENINYDRFYFLGSGIRYGLACEASLKMKEMTLTHSEPFHFLEFRHGPMSMVNQKAVLVGLTSQSNFSHEQAVLNEMGAIEGKIVALGESGVDIAFESGVPESVQGVLYLPILQLMAFYRSLVKGLNPDLPNNLEAVVKLD
jgi:glucosamine--fructose-6-phosphate aminotransferase (isomerizing)